jgi:protein SCO1/2
MSCRLVFLLAFLTLVVSCARPSSEREYQLEGQVIAVEPARKQVTVNHKEIKGFMPAMSMPYDVQDAKLLDGIKAGDLIDATLVVFSNGAHLTKIKKTGEAPLPTPPPDAPMPAASSGFELLKPGEPVPDAPFVDQNAHTLRFSTFKGAPVAITFIYTKCPLPTFCPLMDRHFASMQKALHEDPALKKVHLVTVSFDPVTDSPAVLRAHAKELGADLTRWTFLTGDRDEIDRFAARFGVSISRALNDPRDITHNLRTAIVDRNGKLVKVYTGNQWTPEELLNDLKKLS